MSIVPSAHPSQVPHQSNNVSSNNLQQFNTSAAQSGGSSTTVAQASSSSSSTASKQSNESSQQGSSNQFANLNVSALSSTTTTPTSLSSNKVHNSPNVRSSGQILSIASMIPSASASSTSMATQSRQQQPQQQQQQQSSSIEQSKSQLQLQQNQQQSQQSQATRAASPQPPATTQQPQQTASQQIQQQPIYDDINIFMWSVCKICNRSTKKIAMSPDTWSFSLAKFLELTFHAHNYHQFSESTSTSGGNNFEHEYECCKHSLFQDNYQYFRFKNIVCVFSTSKIIIKSLHIPEVWLKSNVIWPFFIYLTF